MVEKRKVILEQGVIWERIAPLCFQYPINKHLLAAYSCPGTCVLMEGTPTALSLPRGADSGTEFPGLPPSLPVLAMLIPAISLQSGLSFPLITPVQSLIIAFLGCCSSLPNIGVIVPILNLLPPICPRH